MHTAHSAHNASQCKRFAHTTQADRVRVWWRGAAVREASPCIGGGREAEGATVIFVWWCAVHNASQCKRFAHTTQADRVRVWWRGAAVREASPCIGG
jgi:hypothetical protein